ncbi:hypothetical protein PCANC_13551 [Puccinia coronata f. sp. avenae]|uniref:Secreted protein n=1 Tax=Puccinia coronata f. sp. avenae TaxID=200324 RepID=A0A2N5UCM7_9BASI|nr:hypothetical protein PCANC_13551 [Puccinia coronata f. sp. avenae]
MFQAGTLLKIWLLSATITLGILAVVDLAETSGQENLVRRGQLGSNALHRRAPKPGATQTPISAQCGNSFNNQELKKYPLNDDEVACTGYGDRQFKCKIAQCEIRNHVYFPLKKPIPFNREHDKANDGKEKDNYQYHDCKPQFGENKKSVKVYPIRYWAHNVEGNLYVEGYHDTSDKTPRFYICKWKHIRDQNNQRPWCDGCVPWKFEQRLIPAAST